MILLALQDQLSVCTFICQASFKDSLSEVPGTHCIYHSNKDTLKVFFLMFAFFSPLCKKYSTFWHSVLFTVTFNRSTFQQRQSVSYIYQLLSVRRDYRFVSEMLKLLSSANKTLCNTVQCKQLIPASLQNTVKTSTFLVATSLHFLGCYQTSQLQY